MLAIVYPCITPDHENAYCVSLFSCPHLMTAIGSLEPNAIAYVKRSICLGCEAGDFMVCCGKPPQQEPVMNKLNLETDITTTATTATTEVDELTNRFNEALERGLLPSLKFCGFQQTDDRFNNATTTTTAIDEFPWLVHVRFSQMEYEYQFADRCNGVLINNRYVLTNAYCASESIKVKLGEYNTNKTVSCDLSSELTDCTEPVLDLNVEEIVRDGKTSNGPYDFALLRLNQSVPYSDYIRPICLSLDGVQDSKLSSLLISGFGAPNNTGIAKKKLKYEIKNEDVCYQKDPSLKGNIDRANVSFICLTPESNQIGMACGSEHGAPFMYEVSRKHQWFVEGIIVQVMLDSSSDICSKNSPINGIRITNDTIDWILSTIRP